MQTTLWGHIHGFVPHFSPERALANLRWMENRRHLAGTAETGRKAK
jgi:hypothetical protein